MISSAMMTSKRTGRLRCYIYFGKNIAVLSSSYFLGPDEVLVSTPLSFSLRPIFL